MPITTSRKEGCGWGYPANGDRANKQANFTSKSNNKNGIEEENDDDDDANSNRGMQNITAL